MVRFVLSLRALDVIVLPPYKGSTFCGGFGTAISESIKNTNGFENSGSITFNFLTPTRLVVNEDLVVEPGFHHLIRGLLRRISNLSYFHYGERLPL